MRRRAITAAACGAMLCSPSVVRAQSLTSAAIGPTRAAIPTPPSPEVEPEVDGIRRRLGVTLALGGGGAFGAISSPTWHALSLRIGAQIYSPLAIYVQSQLLIGGVSAPANGGAFLGVHNAVLAEFSIQNYVQFAIGPSIDVLWQTDCTPPACVLSGVPTLGLHQRIAVPLISRPGVGSTRGPRGPARAINIALDFHESLPNGSLLVTATAGLGLDWY